ncbi:MAG: helix-turn-helix transcriptional regulator [Lachnospiraceae bacterium]|nr:helix-turn-helix transcriptional regulator [Lachnospiraceae bacterium]MBD5515074.1 helix-turn-helix transcriptional regulator [Lachnospiraceae bacterium]
MGGIPCEAYYYRIGSSIRRNRQEKGLTQEALAEAAGLSLKMVQKLEGGQKGFRMETIIRIAETLEVSLGSLVDMQGEDEKTVSCREMFYELIRDKTIEEIRYAVGIVDSVFKLHKQYLE